nr:hypothetical protein [uncultured Ruminococcus sp.]
MNTTENYVEIIKSLIYPQYLETASLELRDNKTQFKSLVISSPATPYRSSVNNLVFCRLKTEGKARFLAFRSAYYQAFCDLLMQPYQIKSDTEYCRIALDDFTAAYKLITGELANLLNKIFVETMSFSAFGCCSRYCECSNVHKCIHPDQLYATACSYRQNMEKNRIFYGKNKNV